MKYLFNRNQGRSYSFTPGGETKLLLHMDGVDESTTFTDSSASAHVVTAEGDAQLSTDLMKFGTASALLEGGGNYLSIPSSNDWNMGVNPFTIDCWISRNVTSQALCSQYGDVDNHVRWYLISTTTMVFEMRVDGEQEVYVSATDLSLPYNSGFTYKNHVAVIRGWGGNANAFAITLNGRQVGNIDTFAGEWPSMSAPFRIGRVNYGTPADVYWNGYIDEFRVVRGEAWWTQGFIPPWKAYG